MVILNLNENYKDKKEACRFTLTVGEFIEILSGFNMDSPVIISDGKGNYGNMLSYDAREIKIL